MHLQQHRPKKPLEGCAAFMFFVALIKQLTKYRVESFEVVK